eukprot:7766435-Pyramimonas_sp.AAC.1
MSQIFRKFHAVDGAPDFARCHVANDVGANLHACLRSTGRQLHASWLHERQIGDASVKSHPE